MYLSFYRIEFSNFSQHKGPQREIPETANHVGIANRTYEAATNNNMPAGFSKQHRHCLSAKDNNSSFGCI